MPVNLTPMTSLTAKSLPSSTSCPSGLYSNSPRSPSPSMVLSTLRAARWPSWIAVRAVARGPDHVLRVYLLAALELDSLARDLLGHGVGKDLDALVEEPGACGAPQGGVELGQDVGQGLYQVDPDAGRIYVRVVGGEVLVDEGVDLGGHL